MISTSPLGTLIRGLPDAIMKQYEYESKLGQYLSYSSFLRVRQCHSSLLRMTKSTPDAGWFARIAFDAEQKNQKIKISCLEMNN